MPYFFTGILVAIPLIVAAWAHALLPRVVRSRRELWISRLLLVGVGVAFGLTMAARYIDRGGLEQLLVFLASFGIVHLPAAAILFIKSKGGR